MISYTIKLAYRKLTKRDISFLKIKAHEVRTLSSSWAFFDKVPLNEILQAAVWSRSSTFAKFYLRDMSHQAENLQSLGPILLAQKVVGANKSEPRMPNKSLTASKAYSTYIKVIISYIYVRNKLYLRLYFGSYSLEFPESYPEVVGFIYYRARTGDGYLILLNLNL